MQLSALSFTHKSLLAGVQYTSTVVHVLTWFVGSVRVVSLVQWGKNLDHVPKHPVRLTTKPLPLELGGRSPIVHLLVDSIVSLVDRLVA